MSAADAVPDVSAETVETDAEAGAARLVEVFIATTQAMPGHAQGRAATAALLGMLGAILAAMPDPEDRKHAWRALWSEIVNQGIKHRFIRFGGTDAAGAGCGDPDCPTCGGEAGERRPVRH